MSAALRLSVLLPTYRQPEVLVLTLRDLQRQDYPPQAWEAVVIDDGSRDVSAQLALASIGDEVSVTIRRAPRRVGYSHAALFNELLRLAHPASHAFVHVEDVRLRPDFLRQHAKWHAGGQAKLVTGPMYEGPTMTFDAPACSRWQLMRMSGMSAKAYRCSFQAVFAKSMSYPASLRDILTEPGASGPFDEAMTGWGYHETEFAFRAACAGAVCVYDTRCGVYHPAHQQDDEREYRLIDRATTQETGVKSNVEYLCRKHGLARLPDWDVGIPLPDDDLEVTARALDGT